MGGNGLGNDVQLRMSIDGDGLRSFNASTNPM